MIVGPGNLDITKVLQIKSVYFNILSSLSFYFDDKLLPNLIVWLKSVTDYLRMSSCNGKFSNVNTTCCYVNTNSHFIFKYLFAYLTLTAVLLSLVVNYVVCMYTLFLV